MSKNQENKFPEFSVTVNLLVFGMLDESTFESSKWVGQKNLLSFRTNRSRGFSRVKKYENTNKYRGKFLNKPLCCPGGGYYKIKSFVN